MFALASLAAILVTAELARNCMQMLPIRGGSAGERGAGSPDKSFVLLIKPQADPALEGTKDSNRARRLLLDHLGHLNEVDNLWVVNSFQEMLELTLQLWKELEA